MGAKQSTNTRVRAYSTAGQGSAAVANGAGTSSGSHHGSHMGRMRARSLGSVPGHSIPGSSGGAAAASPDSDSSTPPDDSPRALLQASSLPLHLLSFHGIKCPVCSKFVQPDDIECHLVMCLTKPRISYNEDILTEDKGECVICFDDLQQGDTIARLPCLCIYHKGCIDGWFKVNRSCPEHPN